jgi:hypothetical protein
MYNLIDATLAQRVWNTPFRATHDGLLHVNAIKRGDLASVVVDPRVRYMPMDSEQAEWERFLTKAVVFVGRYGNRELWQDPYDLIALSKAFTTWVTGMPSRRVLNEFGYLCGPGMVAFGGSVIDEGGLIVACSGVSSEHDEMLAGIYMALLKGITQGDAMSVVALANEYKGNDYSNYFFGLSLPVLPKDINYETYRGRYGQGELRCPQCDSRIVRYVHYGANAEGQTPREVICRECGLKAAEAEFWPLLTA